MKQVLLALGLLLLVMLGYYWTENRFVPPKADIPEEANKMIYFEVPEKIMAETETEIQLKAKHEKGKIVSFWLNLNFNPNEVRILNVEVNREIFNNGVEAEIDENLGKIMIKGRYEGENETLVNEEISLATVKIKGVKKGETRISVEKAPAIEVWDEEKLSEETFEMPDFKISFL